MKVKTTVKAGAIIARQSSRRWKRNIEPLRGALEIVLKLRGVHT